jgi:hypothetical protein
VRETALRSFSWTYPGDDLVEELKKVLNVRELEDGEPTTVVARDLVVDDHEEADEQVCRSQGSKAGESLLADAGPWGVA